VNRMKRIWTPIVLITLLATCSDLPAAEGKSKTRLRKEFPEASLTIFPVAFTITGPVEKHRQFADRLKYKFREDARETAGIIGRLLEEKGYDQFEIADTDFRFPMEATARKEGAVAFGKFVSELDLRTDYALYTEFTLHLEKGFQEVYSVIVNAKGGVVWEDSQRPGDPDFDKDFPGTPQRCCALVCKRLKPIIGWDKLPKKELSEDKKQALRKMRAGEPPSQSEFEAIGKR